MLIVTLYRISTHVDSFHADDWYNIYTFTDLRHIYLSLLDCIGFYEDNNFKDLQEFIAENLEKPFLVYKIVEHIRKNNIGLIFKLFFL